MVLAEEFAQLIQALEAARLDYALVGGLAVAVWGAPRATKDIDLLVTADAVEAVLAVARTCGFKLEAAPTTFRDGTQLRRVTKVADGDHLTLDLMLVNVDLEPAWQSRSLVPTAEGELWVVSRDALIGMKARAARPQDIYDIERLQELDR